jgi:multidrug transporter EmrE-like cation transporter
MIWLFPSVLVEFGFGQLFKYSQRQNHYAPVVVTANYLTVAVVLFSYLLATHDLSFSVGVVVTGCVTGTIFVASMNLMTRVLSFASAGAVLTAFRMSIAVPVAVGVFVWSEPVADRQVIGILLAISSLAMMTSSAGQNSQLAGLRMFGILAAVFLVQGISHTCLRSVHYQGFGAQFIQFLMVTAATAGAIGLCFLRFHRRPLVVAEIRMGVVIGLYNAMALCIIMYTLSQLPGTLFYPIVGVSTVLLDNLAAHFVWQDRLNRLAVAGVVVALAAIGLVL